MKLYRYRSVTAFLFKELLYQEIYLASFGELNDPLDMTPLVNFRTSELDDARNLARFLLGRILRNELKFTFKGQERNDFRANQRNAVIEALRTEDKLDAFAIVMLHEMNRRNASSQGIISCDCLFRLLQEMHVQRPQEFSFLDELEAVQDNIDATITTFFNNSHVACFAEEGNNFLMWSHYADRHQGICMEFELSKQCDAECHFPIEMWAHPNTAPYEGPHELSIKGWRYHEAARKVAYVDTIDAVSFYDFLPVFANEGDVDLHCLSKSRWHPFADRLRETFLQKLKRWESEKEWRIVHVNFKRSDLPEDRNYRYCISALKGIVFGYRTTEDVKRRIRNIVRRKSDKVTFYDATMRDDGTISVAHYAVGEPEEFK